MRKTMKPASTKNRTVRLRPRAYADLWGLTRIIKAQGWQVVGVESGEAASYAAVVDHALKAFRARLVAP